MGHTSSVSLGYSLFTNKKTICLDGDGSFLMHMGSLKTISDFGNKNLKYILLNNNSHESVGGQTTNSDSVNFSLFSKSLGFKKFYQISNYKNIQTKIKKNLYSNFSVFAEIKINESKKNNLPRPKSLAYIKNQFMK